MEAFRLDNEIAVITGGETGLGLGMARSTVAAGARVVTATAFVLWKANRIRHSTLPRSRWIDASENSRGKRTPDESTRLATCVPVVR